MVDVGAGDGQLSRSLALDAGCSVIAVELRPGSLARLRERVADLAVEVREGDGLAPIAPGEAEVAVIAGMGGRSIERILKSRPEVVAGLRLVVLQPMQGADGLRAALMEAFGEMEETSVVDSGRRYTVLTVRP